MLLKRKLEKIPVFQPPHDLTPLMLSQCIFQIDVSSNMTDRTIEGSITYLSLIQATLLDWIDRGNLSLVEKEGRGYFRVNHYDTLSTYELDVMDLLFANKTEIALHDLYEAYSMNQGNLSRLVGVKDIPLRLVLRFKQSRQKIRDSIKENSKQLGLDALIEPVSKQDKTRLETIYLSYWLSLGFNFYMLIDLLSRQSSLSLLAGILCLWLINPPFLKPVLDALNEGIWTEAGIREKSAWTSFIHTLARNIRGKEQSIDDLLLWNRYLVYLTCFGFSQKINENFTSPIPHLNLSEEGKSSAQFGEEFLLSSHYLTIRRESR